MTVEAPAGPIRIALCQVNPTVGALSANLELLLTWYRRALAAGAQLVVFPELVITGYPPSDLLYEGGFVVANQKILQTLARQVTTPAIVGYVRADGEKLFNSAALLRDGKIIG
ncbi:MAG: nitrilase-related carbon-nitrogen hydrolase, partial [Candidatus Neomarinimicrobiota bacterium]